MKGERERSIGECSALYMHVLQFVKYGTGLWKSSRTSGGAQSWELPSLFPPPTYPHLQPVCGRRKAAECAWCAAVGPGLQKCFSCSLALAAGQQVDLLSGFVDKWCVLAEISCTLTSLCLILSHQKAGKAASKCSTSDDDESQQNSSGKETGQLHRWAKHPHIFSSVGLITCCCY